MIKMNLTDDVILPDAANRTASSHPAFDYKLSLSSSSSSSSSPLSSLSSSYWNLDSIPLEELLQNDWLSQNISQMFNISVDNLTNLLMNSQQQTNQRDAISLLSIVTVFYALIFAAGVLGNLITCIVISRNKFMHTATNFYLFNLAVSDLILLLSGMPQDLYNIWYPMSYPFSDVPCIIESVLSETAANATVLTITAFTVERYIAICHPFRQHTMSKLSRAIKFILAIWVTAFILALPQAMQFSVVKQNDGKLCSMDNDFVVHVFAVSGFIFFCGPMTAICVLYVLIGVKLKRSRLLQAVPRRCYDVNRGISAQSRVIRMLVAVAFFLCWAPFHAQRLMAVYGSTSGVTSPLFEKIFRVLDYTSGVLYFLSTCINPLLYNIMSHKFRDAFKITLARHFGLTGKYQMTNHNYSALLRQNGSMRLHTSVNNNNAIEHYNSYRVVQLQCRDRSHHLSLQDSIRTTTTTTNGGAANSRSRSRAHRMRCISVGSQSTLMTSLGGSGKNDFYSTNSYAMTNSMSNNRDLQTQISQMSSLDDANSLLDSDGQYHIYQQQQQQQHKNPSAPASYHHKDLRCPAPSTSKIPDELSMDSIEWQDNNNIGADDCDNDTDVFTRPVAPMAPNPPADPLMAVEMNSITELTINPRNRRHKLSRIIRRDANAFTSPRVELMKCQLPGVALSQIRTPLSPTVGGKVRKSTHNRKTGKTFESLSEKLRWKAKRKVPFLRVNANSNSRKNNISPTALAPTLAELPLTVGIMRPMPSSVEEEPSSTANGDSPVFPKVT